MSSDAPRLDKLFDMVAEREGPCKTGAAPSKWSYEAILDLTDFARTLERENAALTARVAELERDAKAKQAKIDDLMMEYCPNEMTQEQLHEWVNHQKPVLDAARGQG